MKIILLSGGSGKRLWPLSNGVRSKQFLKVLKNKDNESMSMLQRVWRQLASAGLTKSTYIVASKTHADFVESQVGGEVTHIIEPVGKDTFPAIALACSYLFSEEYVDLNEVICVLPVDPYVEEEFFDTVKILESILANSKTSVALIGSKPTYPSEKYGYIIPSQENAPPSQTFLPVEQFIEKPDQATARKLIETMGAFWNCGVFAFRLDYVISYLIQNQWPTDFNELIKSYDKLPSKSFDYELLHHNQTDRKVVVPYDKEWKDLGTWNTLTEEIEAGVFGKGNISKDSNNTHIINELDIPVLVLGLSDVIVACSPDGILVADKAASPRLKELLPSKDQRPMYEERRWGWYRVLDHWRNDDEEVLTKRLVVKAGKNLSYQLHQKRREIWSIVSGHGIFVIDGKFVDVKKGDVLQIPVGAKHTVKALTDLTIIEVQSGSELVEEDIVRFLINWDDIEDLR